jgi:beta-lactamase regulating signal transducer with metallopeptidase domain/cytochrome c-type biogenesis protein CcmH/NrfG
MIGEMTNHLWQSTLFAVAIALLTIAFRENRAQVRYWLWFSASVKFFVPFTLLIALGSRLNAIPFVSQIVSPSISIAIDQFAQPFTALQTADTFGPAARTDWTSLILFGVWAAGFVMLAWTRLRSWRRIRSLVQRSSPLELSDMQMPVGLHVRSCPGLLEPGVVGWLHPVLLLPSDIMDRLTPRQFQAVLAHELCHVRRLDNLTSVIHMAVEAIFWFHPLVWWVGARLVDERERACDEEVLQLGNEAHVYSEGILKVCKAYLASPVRCVSGVTGSDLKKRIQSILAGHVAGQLTRAKKAALVTAGFTAVIVPVVVGMMIHAEPIRAQDEPHVEIAEEVRDALNKGIRAYKEGSFQEAVRYFEKATALDPSFTIAELYLATAYAQEYMPGAATEENRKYAELAIQKFSKVLQTEPNNATALAGLGSIYLKDSQLQKARETYLRNLEVDARTPGPRLGLGNVSLAMVADPSGNLSPAERIRLIDDGLRYAREALGLDPQSYQAMSTLSLLYRQQAAIASTRERKSALEAEAASWLEKSIATEKQVTEERQDTK